MKYILSVLTVMIVTGFQNPAIAASMDMSDSVMVGHISVSDVWSRSSAGMKRAGAIFLTLTNTGSEDDRLISASTPAAKRAELHGHTLKDGIMKMRPVDGVPIGAGGSVQLKPGGHHIMLMKLTNVLEEGQKYPVQLTFEKAGDVTVMVHIGKPGAMGSMNHMKHGDHMKYEDHMRHDDHMRHEDHMKYKDHLKHEDHMNHEGHMKHDCHDLTGDQKTKCMEKAPGSNN